MKAGASNGGKEHHLENKALTFTSTLGLFFIGHHIEGAAFLSAVEPFLINMNMIE